MSATIDAEKTLVELMLYVAAKCGLDAHYSVLKLNTILFYSDFRAYRTLGEPITGVEYRKYPHGPAPAMMKALRKRLFDNEDTFEYINPLPALIEGMNVTRLLPRRAADMTLFSSSQIALVDQVIEWLRPMTSSQTRNLSYRHHPGWRLAKLDEPIPYCAALLSEDLETQVLSIAERNWALTVANRFVAGQ